MSSILNDKVVGLSQLHEYDILRQQHLPTELLNLENKLVWVFDITEANTEITLRTMTTIDINWGDGTIDKGGVHTYVKPGKYVASCTIGEQVFAYTFEGNKYIISVYIPECVSLINSYAFMSCSNLRQVVFQDTGDVSNPLTISHYALSYTGVKGLKLPERTTTLQSNCLYGGGIYNGDNELIIPKNITTIDTSFGDTKNIVFESLTPPTISSHNQTFIRNSKIIVPIEALDTYKTATNWVYWADKIVSVVDTNYLDEKLEAVQIDLNLENGEGKGSLQQKVFEDDTKNSKSTGFGAIALGGFRGDKPDNSPDDEDTTTTAEGIQSFAVGAGNHAYGNWSVVMGKDSSAYQRASVALGGKCIAGNPEEPNNGAYGYALAQGELSQAKGWASAAFNKSTVYPIATYGFAANNGTVNAPRATAFGASTAENEYAFSAGISSRASGYCSTSVGENNRANHHASVIFGSNNNSSANYQTVLGLYNEDNENALFIVGNGDSDKRQNAFEISKGGSVKIANNLDVSNSITCSGLTCNNSGGVSAAWLNVSAARINKIEESVSVVKDLYIGGDISTPGNLNLGAANSVEGSRSAAIGLRNTLSSSSYGSLAVGEENEVSNGYAIAMNYHTKALKFGSSAFGAFTKTNNNYQLVCGLFNEAKANTLFEVGNGSSDNLNNAFEVLADGHARVYAKPESDADLIRLCDVEPLIEIAKSLTKDQIKELIKFTKTLTVTEGDEV